jgi:circadian clock protein KaiB
MNKAISPDRSEDFERAMRGASVGPERYVLRLYITGNTPRSSKAIKNIRTLCEQFLPGRYDLEVIDLYQQPVLAVTDQVVAAPTLIKKLPSPLRKFIGDLSNLERIRLGLNLGQTSPQGKTDPQGN